MSNDQKVDTELASKHGLRLSMDAWAVWVALLLAVHVKIGVLQHISW